MKCAMIGKTDTQQVIKRIHDLFGCYEYELLGLPEEGLESFLKRMEYRCLDVAEPYQQEAVKYCDRLSSAASETGFVNALVRDSSSRLCGYNTEPNGILYMAKKANISLLEKKVLILGDGNAARSAKSAARRSCAREIVVIPMNTSSTEGQLLAHCDAECIINTTDIGAYPNNGSSPVDLDKFPRCFGVMDIISNPLRSAFVLLAKEKGIPAAGGLPMLVGQAKQSCELFTGEEKSNRQADEILKAIYRELTNIVLIGMPGCGKTELGKLIASKLGRDHYDVDQLAVEMAGMSIPELFRQQGEAAFRSLESRVIEDTGKHRGIVLSTGGGSLLARRNYWPLKQNSIIVFIERALSNLPSEGRPLSAGGLEVLSKMYKERLPYYQRNSDYCVENQGTLEQTAEEIMEVLYETAGN